MKKKIAKKLRQRKQKILNRLDKRSLPEHPGPMFNPGNIHYEMADRARGIAYSGMGAMQLLVKTSDWTKPSTVVFVFSSCVIPILNPITFLTSLITFSVMVSVLKT